MKFNSQFKQVGKITGLYDLIFANGGVAITANGMLLDLLQFKLFYSNADLLIPDDVCEYVEPTRFGW